MKQITFILTALIFISNCSYGQDAGFTGYATSIVDQNKVEINTYGFQDKIREVKYDSLTMQPIGSVSKVVIGLAIMKAVDLGFINIDTDINEYLNFKIANPNLKNGQPITLRHLGTHTSGITDNERYYVQGYKKGLQPPYQLGEFLKSYLTPEGTRYSKKNFGKNQPGKAYSYSNFGAALAAHVIENASKMPFDQFTETYIFQPLMMEDTHWHYKEIQMGAYSILYDEKDKPMDFYSLTTYPDGGLKTNIVDLSKMLQTIIKGYQGDSELLSETSWKLFFDKNFSQAEPIKGMDPSEPNSGIFIIYSNSGSIGHTGSDPGVSSVMFFDPETMKGKIFMANEDLTKHNVSAFKSIWQNL
ncbi:beta-lactamase family protein [Belliella sp. R4-6]|uniref:Beta-lactamase family protein n=1 Tax=Belliella alkalica TaxID=1730871 RepID=A0ABS9VCT1_9BACT|nr:serine hydrolase domain-containing protein [Belliella alkalica]MCH7414178.1 beta-lactamase family protein [Belliella alkalica]